MREKQCRNGDLMENEKIENLLNLALDATPQEREKSVELDVGYDKEERTWEVIVKTGGDEAAVREALRAVSPEEAGQIRITNLSNEYMILVIPEALVEAVAALPLIEYMEKPKRLFFAVNNGKRASCINSLQRGSISGGGSSGTVENLTGKNVIVAVIDSGERVIVLSGKRWYNSGKSHDGEGNL